MQLCEIEATIKFKNTSYSNIILCYTYSLIIIYVQCYANILPNFRIGFYKSYKYTIKYIIHIAIKSDIDYVLNINY